MRTAFDSFKLDKSRNVCYQCCLTRFWGFAARGPDAATTDAAVRDTPVACAFAARCGGMGGGIGGGLACASTRPAIRARGFAAGRYAGEAEAQTGDEA
jgi:hypothetical protein